MPNDNGGPTIIQTGGGGSGAGWFVAVLVLIAVLVGGYFFMNGKFNGGKDINVKVELPKTKTN